MSQVYANAYSVEHLIELSNSITAKGNEYHKAVIHGIGEAGGRKAVDHLIELSDGLTIKGNEYHKAVIRALGRAGRIS